MILESFGPIVSRVGKFELDQSNILACAYLMRSLAGHSFGINSFSFADKLKTHWFGNAVIDNKGRKQLEYFVFVQKDLSVPDNVELFISCIQSVYHVDVIHLYNLSV
jgi:hypothetical protein